LAKALTCWKDIARYLGKGVRTVQRWETDMGFPIRRIEAPTRTSRVFAIPEEIDHWIQSQGHRKPADSFETLRRENAELRKKVQELELTIRSLMDRQ
jgi:hypothetical protein